MNILRGQIRAVSSAGALTLVDVAVEDVQMTAIMIGTPEQVGYLAVGSPIELIFNESEVSLGRMEGGEISLNNQLPCRVEAVVPGEILSQVALRFADVPLRALITTRSVQRLALQPGDSITAFIKTTEVLLRASCEGRDAD